ncbi:MAG: TIGR02453 family protein [Blastocatellia bacterium]|nr:MAG: TIGR02453 family protein [Blastocatellia bacterium]
MAAAFTGFPAEAFEFFKNLQMNNNREWFLAHKDVYERACREPMKALTSALEPKFGASKISRINRDMRFSRDRAPYKTHIAAGIGGYYISLSVEGVYVAAGIYRPEPDTLKRLRAAIDHNGSGRELTSIVSALRRKGYQVDSHETIASAPKGYAADHPRIDLLRMKDLFAGKLLAPSPSLSTGKAFDRITAAISELQPFKRWVERHVQSKKWKVESGK